MPSSDEEGQDGAGIELTTFQPSLTTLEAIFPEAPGGADSPKTTNRNPMRNHSTDTSLASA